MNQQKELVKNTLIIAIGKLSTQFLSFLLLPIYTLFLSPTEYGTLDLVVVYLGLLAPVLTVQMEMAVFRHLIDARVDKERAPRIISSSFAVALAGGLAGAVLIGIYGLLASAALAPYILAAFVSTIFSNFFLQVARGLGRNDVFAMTSILIGLVNIALSLVAVIVLGWSVSGILLALALANLIGASFLVVRLKAWRYIGLANVKVGEARSLLGYSWPLVPNHISLWGIGGISRTLIASILGLAAMGIYAAANKFTLIYTSLYSVFAMSWTESVSLHISKKDDFLSKASNSMLQLFGCLTLFIISASALLFPLLVSGDFSQARYYVPLLLLGGFFGSLVTHYGAIYLAVKQTSKIAIITFQAVMVSTVLTLAGIFFMGLYAPAIAIIVTYLYIAIRRHSDVQQYTKIRYEKKTIVGLLSIATVVFILYYINNPITDIVSVITTALLAVVLNKNEISRIIAIILKRREQ